MGYAKKAETKTTEAKDVITFKDMEFTRIHLINDDLVMFDCKVRGIQIYGMSCRHYKNDKGEGDIIGFPSRKSKEGKYYNEAWFPISAELKEEIVQHIEKELSE